MITCRVVRKSHVMITRNVRGVGSAMRRRWSLLLAVVIAGGVVLTGHPVVHASGGDRPSSTVHLSPAQTASVSCSSTACNGKSPYVTGCSADGTPVYSSDAPIRSLGGNTGLGTVRLYWSPTCQTNWAVVKYTAASGPSTAFVQAIVEGASSHIYYWAKCTSCSKYTTFASPMYYAPTESVEARGYVNPEYPDYFSWRGDGAQSQTGSNFDMDYCGGGRGDAYCYA